MFGGLEETDRRGKEVLNFISTWNVTIINGPNSIPTYSCTKGECQIDLKLTRNIDDRHIREWKDLDQETLSDHILILTEVNFQKTGRTECRKILKFQDMKILDFKKDLKELINTFSEADITSENLKDYIDKFYEGLYLICEINQKKISENKRKNAIWWNSNLEIKRRKVRALRRRFQAIVDFEERIARRLIYKRELANYKKEILIAKQIRFRKFLDNVVKKNLFGIPYDIIKQNECNKLKLNRIRRVYNRGIQTVIDSIEDNKSPGIDDLTNGIIKELIYADMWWCAKVMNCCFENGIFPTKWRIVNVTLIPKEGKDTSLPSS
ncbi:hypothetical protein AVEN_198654-1 [Araneus ventricosus]|uniref:Endonuclease/exonuclease/phosphatase domain-containing protein n=1 Tax=Araneus ventricosus TaxID=182803 RepID=A0A4Y2L7S8_ARAVE|nr:hypothetical protein AVEN_198654-1 [Araneus ventricosus]